MMRSGHAGASEAMEARLIRERIEDLAAPIDRRGDSASGSVVVVGVTYQVTSYPTVPNAFYGLRPASVAGAEAEGGTATVTPGAGSIVAYNLGTQIPPAGTSVIAVLCGDRYVFRYDG